jgi:hypothetical protein
MAVRACWQCIDPVDGTEVYGMKTADDLSDRLHLHIVNRPVVLRIACHTIAHLREPSGAEQSSINLIPRQSHLVVIHHEFDSYAHEE